MRVLALTLLTLLALPAVAAANEPPTCRPERVTKGVLGFYVVPCSDPDSTNYEPFEIVTPPAYGRITDHFGLVFTYEPDGRPREDTMTIVAIDDQGARSEPTTITIAAPWGEPSCYVVSPGTVTAGLSTTFGPCFGEHVELVTPPQHGAVSFVPVFDTITAVYEPAYDAGGSTDSFVMRAVTPDAVSPDYRVELTVTPPAAAPAVPALLPAPQLDLRVGKRIRRGRLPLTLSSDVPGTFAVTVSRRGTPVGTATTTAAGRLTVPIAPGARRAKRFVVTVLATADGRAPHRLTEAVRVR